MAWLPLLLLFSSSFMGTFSQVVLTQPESVAGSPGGSIRITCTKNSGTLDTGDSSWYQQKPGNAPKLLIYADSSRASGIPERFSGSIENSKTSAVLTISNLQAEDEADYHCLYYVGGGQWVFGGGTQLTVTGQPAVSPSVQVFAPSEEEIKIHKKATLVCLLSGFHPASFNLKWKVDGTETTSGVETTKANKQGDKYLASSYLTRSDSNYGGHTYVCEVTHDGKTFTKSISGSGSC